MPQSNVRRVMLLKTGGVMDGGPMVDPPPQLTI